MFPSANVIPYNGNTWWFLIFLVEVWFWFVFFFTFWEVLVEISEVKLTASFEPHSFVHCRIFPQLPVCRYIVVFFGFPACHCSEAPKTVCIWLPIGLVYIWNSTFFVVLVSLIPALWFWYLYALILKKDSKFANYIWNLDHQHVNFKVLRDSEWVQQRLTLCSWPPEYWVEVLI